MACFYPRQAIRIFSMLSSKGKSLVRFVSNETAERMKISRSFEVLSGLPCGECVGCRLERSRQWAIRCINEAQLHDFNWFVTLTFDEFSLQARREPMSLDKSDFQKFMKRLRKSVGKVRYYMCGEYGELFKRPHYHAILFGVDFPDRKLEKCSDGMRYYSSDFLHKLWPFGRNIITDVTFDTCAYVARYIMKKVLGKDAWKSYFQYLDEFTGELVGHRLPEYTTMSRRSGIGKAWLDKYLQDVYPKDKIFMRGRGFSKPPKYYDSQYEIVNPSDYSRLKQARVEAALLRSDDNTQDRLKVKEAVKLSQIDVLKRNLE
jgi:hypothetical protein